MFDTWRVYPEVVNFAIANLPQVFAVPGQHDLPHHRYQDIHRTAYWTLVEAGKIVNLEPGKVNRHIPGVDIYGVPWGYDFSRISGKSTSMKIAVVHRFCWSEGHSHPGAKEEDHVVRQWEDLKSLEYDAAVFGDNHSGFLFRGKVINCGTPIRRRSDEWDYQPKVGLLWEDGKIGSLLLDTSIDKMIWEDYNTGVVGDGGENAELVGLIQALKEGMSSLDFREALEHHTRTTDLRPGTKRLIAKLLEGT